LEAKPPIGGLASKFSHFFMQTYKIPNIHNEKIILALGAESAGNFSLWKDGIINFSEDFGDLTNEQNFSNFKVALLKFLKNQKIKPDIILSDLHPLFETTKLAQKLAKKYKAEYLPVQHHFAHVFSAVGDEVVELGTWSMEQKLISTIQYTSYKIPHTILGVACDGTGLGTDGKIWGGEVFTMTNSQKTTNNKTQNSKLQITRIGHLENQILLGGEMAIQEPARMLIAILFKISNAAKKFPLCHSGLDPESSKSHEIKMGLDSHFHGNDTNVKIEKQKKIIFSYIKKYYTPNEFEVLWKQLEQNFNCLETSSTARVLDAVSVLLGFSNNERLSKHGPIALLEKNSTKSYLNLNPKITTYNIQNTRYGILDTTYLFEYLIKNLDRDKARLAATAQKYIADGMLKIVQQFTVNSSQKHSAKIFAAGGMMNNKIISEIMEKQGFYLNKKIPRGDAGISFGQIIFYLLTK